MILLGKVQPWVPIVGILLGGGFPGTWLVIQYQQPQIVIYEDGAYSKLGNDLTVGTIFVVNQGRTPETNLSVVIGETVAASDIAINYLTTSPDIVSDGQQTRITIPRLKPKESAEIVFRSRYGAETFSVNEVTSDSGNIRYEEWVKESFWTVSGLQIATLWIAVTLAVAVGYWLGALKIGANPRQRRKKSVSLPKV